MKLGKHTFKVGEQVKLPGTQIKFTGFGTKNKFMWDITGTIEELGWSMPFYATERTGWTEPDANGVKSAIYYRGEIQLPMYKVNGKWYSKNQVEK